MSRGGGLSRLGLEEVLIAEEDGEHQDEEGHGGAHIATTAAATGCSRRLKIRIANLGQRILPVELACWQALKGGLYGPLLSLWYWFVGNWVRKMSGRYLIEPSACEWMAAQEPPDGQRCAAHGAMSGDGNLGIFRARGLITAATGADGMDRRGEPAAIERESGEQDARHSAGVAMWAAWRGDADTVSAAMRAASALAC